MSTYMYLECHTHTPAIESDRISESQRDAPKILAALKNDIPLIMKYHDLEITNPQEWFVSIGEIVRRVNRFVIQHPNCDLSVVDEYGQKYV